MKGYSKEIDQILEREPDLAFARRARIIFENLDLIGEEKVLEVGCGRGFYLKTLKSVWPDLDVTGVDVNQKYLDNAREFLRGLDVKLIKGDATRLPFKSQAFDRIIASEVLEHIPDDQRAISEMYRVLKPEGIAMITVPNKDYPFCWDPINWLLERVFNWHIPSDIWWLAGIWADHVRLYNEKELRDKMEKKGFKIEKVWSATHFCFPFSHFLFYGVGKNLVEKGFLKRMNRFSEVKNNSILKDILLWPVRKVDHLNDIFRKTKEKHKSSMNLILLAEKK